MHCPALLKYAATSWGDTQEEALRNIQEVIDLVAIVIVGMGTYFSRALFIVVLANRRIPDPVLVSLQFVAPAVLAALVVALLIDEDEAVAIGIPELAAFAVGGGIAYKTRSHIWTLVAGMTVYWVVRAVL